MLNALTRPARRAARFAGRLHRCRSGLAFTEFALSLPVLVTLGLVGLETANLAMVHLRISNIAMLTADNAGRIRDTIDEANVNELLYGARMSGDSIRFAQNGRIILSSIEPNAAGQGGASTGQYIRWQRCTGAKNIASAYGAQGAGQTNNSLQQFGVAGSQIAATTGTAIMLVEVVYDYQPVVSSAIFGNRVVRYESAFNVRQRNDQVLKNATNLTAAQLRTCNFFTAT